mmetsp:Transcript_33515/g.58710  ORF Transcript_33515/g.58710 Transcript_33515/m.58710 type:complete len:111 (+) Transcript_33515:2795-3127(+)
MHRVKPKFEVLVSAELAALSDLYEAPYKRAKIVIPMAQELAELKDIYCERRTPAPTKRDLSSKSTQPILKLKAEVEVEGRRLTFKQPKLTSMFQQTKSRSRKKLYKEEAV